MLKKRTPAEWEVILSIKIVDFQGWQYSFSKYKPKVFHKKISRREFYCRAMRSLIRPK